MVELAEIGPDHRVLEPSAGPGNLLRAIGPAPDKVAVEINPQLVELLARTVRLSGLQIHQGDFLTCNGDLGTFDRIIMNPPRESTGVFARLLGTRLRVSLVLVGQATSDILTVLA